MKKDNIEYLESDIKAVSFDNWERGGLFMKYDLKENEYIKVLYNWGEYTDI